MNKTGARILGGFSAALIEWVWNGWFATWTGVKLEGAILTCLGGAMIVIAEWVLVKEPIGRAARSRLPTRRKRGAQGGSRA